MAQANEALQAHVLRPQQEALNLRRTQARDELAAALRGGELADGLCENVLSALPKQGSLKYAILCKRNPEAAQAVRDAVRDQVEADARLASLRDEYLAAVQENADLKALSPDARAAYVHAAEADLENRLANALIANARGGEAPKPIARQSTNAAEAYLPPVERRWTLALQEELGSCLTSDERKALRLGIASATEGQTLDGEARRALSKLPTLKAAPPTGVTLAASAEQAIANGAHGIRNIMEQAAGGSRPDAGDDAGRNAMNVGSRILARALRAVLRGIVPLRAAQAPALRVALKLKG